MRHEERWLLRAILLFGSILVKGHVVDDPGRLWPDGFVPYHMDETFDLHEQDVIYRGMRDLELKTCVRFVPHTQGKDVVKFVKEPSRCSSSIGRVGGEQMVRLSAGCLQYIGEVQHELMHVLGFMHEHTRRDRIVVSLAANKSFVKKTTRLTGLPYDYFSVMHFGWNFYAKNRSMPTLSPKKEVPDWELIGSRRIASDLDIRKIDTAYQCHSSRRPGVFDADNLDYHSSSDDEGTASREGHGTPSREAVEYSAISSRWIPMKTSAMERTAGDGDVGCVVCAGDRSPCPADEFNAPRTCVFKEPSLAVCKLILEGDDRWSGTCLNYEFEGHYPEGCEDLPRGRECYCRENCGPAALLQSSLSQEYTSQPSDTFPVEIFCDNFTNSWEWSNWIRDADTRSENLIIGGLEGSLRMLPISTGINATTINVRTTASLIFQYGLLTFRARAAMGKGIKSAVALKDVACGAESLSCETIEVSIDGEQADQVALMFVGLANPNGTVIKRHTGKSLSEYRVYQVTWTDELLEVSVDGQAFMTIVDKDIIPNQTMSIHIGLSIAALQQQNKPLLRSQPTKFRNTITTAHFDVDFISFHEWSGATTKSIEVTRVWYKTKTFIALVTLLPLLAVLLCVVVLLRRQQMTTQSHEASVKLSKESSSSHSLEGDDEVFKRYISLLEITPEQITCAEVLGSGQSGVVNKGYLSKGDVTRVVAIKTVKSDEGDENRTALDEVAIMSRIGQHLNIVNLIGVVLLDRYQVMLVLEYCPLGSLLGYLKKQKPRMEKDGEAGLESKDLVTIAYQISRGMEYLASKAIVHRDLACRNVLVVARDLVKISDFGLAKHVVNEEYLCLRNIPLPVRWMAPESITKLTFTEKTDVWSFGITMREMFAFGERPFSHLTLDCLNVKDFANALRSGLRMERPEAAPKEMYTIMEQCWHLSPDMRPTFAELRERLETFVAAEYYQKLDEPYAKFNYLPVYQIVQDDEERHNKNEL